MGDYRHVSEPCLSPQSSLNVFRGLAKLTNLMVWRCYNLHQLWEGNEQKPAFCSEHGHCKHPCVLLGLLKAPSTFQHILISPQSRQPCREIQWPSDWSSFLRRLIPLRKHWWLHRLLTWLCPMIPAARASQTAPPGSQAEIGRSSGGVTSKPSTCELWGHTLLAAGFVGRVLRAPLGLIVCVNPARSPLPSHSPQPHLSSGPDCSSLTVPSCWCCQ